MNNRVSKFSTLLICAAFLASFIGASVFIFQNAGHICPDGNCSVCVSLQQCENTVNSVSGAAGKTGFFSYSASEYLILSTVYTCIRSSVSTLITLKVMLLD